MLQIDRHGNFKNFLYNIPLIISFCAFACLTVHSISKAVFALLGSLVLLFVSFHTKTKNRNVGRNTTKGTIVSVAMLLIIIGVSFYSDMIHFSKIKSIADMLGMSHLVIVFFLACIGVIAASYFCFWMVGVVQSDIGEMQLKAVIDSGCVKNTVMALALLGMMLAIVCSFNGSIWTDEAYSLRIIQYSYKEIIAMCAADVHPPFYYMALKFVEDFGANFFDGYYSTVVIGKLFSVLAYVLLTVLCWHKLRNENKARPFVLLCIYGMPQLLSYAIEIRMYSWALLFVTASFLYARDIVLRNSTKKTWIFLTIFSVLSAYSHTFALIAMASIWLYLLIWSIIYHRQDINKWFCYGSFVGILFFPWLIVLLRQVGYVTESYWISPITWSNIPDFAKYIFSETMLLIPFLLFIGIAEKKKVVKKSVFESAFGVLIPLTTIFIGIIASIIIRPVFVSRYMIPGLMCLWISIILTSKKCNYKIQTIIFLLLIVSSVSSFTSFAKKEIVSKKEAEKNLSLVESFEENAIIIISCNTHTSDVVASYTDNMVYNWRGPELTTATIKYREAYKNENIFDDVSQISEWLNEGIPLYYIETVNSKENERLPVQKGEWDIEYIGEHTFEQKTVVYKIVLEGGV